MKNVRSNNRKQSKTLHPRKSYRKPSTQNKPRPYAEIGDAIDQSDTDKASIASTLSGERIINDLQNNSSEALRLDELSEKQLEIFAQNCWLVSLIENKVAVRAALKRLGITRSERSVRDLMRRFKKYGRHGLFDQRWFRRTEAEVLTSPVKKLAMAIYFEHSAAGSRAIWNELRKVCIEHGFKQPSESTVRKFLTSLPETFKMFRQGKSGVRKWEQTAAPVVRYENTQFANERWQGGHSPLQIWVRAKARGEWQAFRAYISVVLDAHSRSIAGFVVSAKYPDAWTIALLFHQAIMPKRSQTWHNKGIPFVFQTDCGKDFLSHAVAATLGKLNTILDPDPPYYPNRKGKVERWFQTLDTGCLRILPGHMDKIGTSEGAAAKHVNEFLTVPQLTAEIERWIDEDYHRRTHSETGRKPAELWEETVRLRMPDNEDALNLLLLKYDVECNVKNTGVRARIGGIRRIYWTPVLMHHFQQRVRIAYNPEDSESVLVYCAASGKFICEAFDMRAEHPRYTVSDVLRERGQFRRGMKERIKSYMDEVYHKDRRMARIDEWEEARQRALAAQEADTSNETIEDDTGVIVLLEKFRRRDRGED